MTRNKKAVSNIISNIGVQLIVVLSGFILPRLILSCFGSTVNGIVGSISQFLAYAGLVEMGVGNASIAVLYEPIVQKNNDRISIIVSSVRKKYLISGCLYTVIVVALAIIYPLLIDGQIGYWFAFSMIIIIACNSMIDLFIIGKYKVLLIANQKNYILNYLKALKTIISTVLSCVVLILGGSVILVEIIVVLAHFCEAILVSCYTKYCYPNIYYGAPGYIRLAQQKNTLIHQVSMVITYNTDRIVLILAGSQESLKEVSVYGVYALALSAITTGISCFITGMEAIFGEMAAKNEKIKLQKIFELYETVYLFITYLLYACFWALIIPFVRCYTQGVNDINYIRLDVGILFGICGLLASQKDAHGIIIKAYGCYRQTQKYVIAEAIVNIILSVLMAPSMGIVGVLIGTFVSHLITSIAFSHYADKYLLQRNPFRTLRDNFINMAPTLILVLVEIDIVYAISDWQTWILSAMAIFVVNAVVLCGINAMANRENFRQVMKYFKRKAGRGEK